jgi:ComEC/Rec2-related protein
MKIRMDNSMCKSPNAYIDKLFNVRPFVFWALFVATTAFLLDFSMWFGVGIVAFLLITMPLLRFIRTRDAVVKFLGGSYWFFAGSIILILLTMTSFYITEISYNSAKNYVGEHELVGTIESYHLATVEGGLSLCTIGNAKFDGHRVDGRVIIFVSDYSPTNDNAEKLRVGDALAVQTTIKVCGAENININTRTKYSANADYADLFPTGARSHSLKHTVRRYCRALILSHMSTRNGNLMFSMLFGDDSSLENKLNDNFRTLGVFHIIAVSGFNVAMLFGIMFPILKVCRVPRKYQFFVVAGVLFFYCYLCDFGFSIMRASLMALVFLFNRTYLRNSDFLSSIGLAALVILLPMPHAIFSWSFTLSFVCVYGIALFNTPIYRLLNRMLPKKTPLALWWGADVINKGIAMYMAVTIAIFPLIILYFGNFPTYGLLANILFIPVFTISFVATVIAVQTYVGFILLYPIDYLLDVTHFLMDRIAAFPLALIHITASGHWYLLYLAGIFVISRFFFLHFPHRYNVAAGLFCVYLISLFL